VITAILVVISKVAEHASVTQPLTYRCFEHEPKLYTRNVRHAWFKSNAPVDYQGDHRCHLLGPHHQRVAWTPATSKAATRPCVGFHLLCSILQHCSSTTTT
jgi:hypothetical protein